MDDSVTIRIEIRVREKRYGYQHTIPELDWERLGPITRPLFDPSDAYFAQRAAEERRRYIDMLASKISYALTHAINSHEQRVIKD